MKAPFLTTSRGVLFADDCLAVLRQMRPAVIDTVFADPPFNIGKNYRNGYDDRVRQVEYMAWCRDWIAECCRVLKPALTMKGTYPRGRKLYPAHYALLYYSRGTPRVFNKLRLPIETCRHCGKEIKDYGGHRDKMNPEGVNLTDFWTDTSPNRHRKFKVRPGVNELKPIIPERAILISTDPDDLVFDPFGGGGSTYQAAEKHDRYWIGTEWYDAAYIRKRIQENYPFSAAREPQFDFQGLFDHGKTDRQSVPCQPKRKSRPSTALFPHGIKP